MTNKPNVQSVQDMPPKGGYPNVNYKRDLRPRGPSNKAQWGIILFLTTFGFYHIGQNNIWRREAKFDKRTAKINLFPYLQYEHDLALAKEVAERLAKEKELMKDNPNWVVGARRYSKRWGDPSCEF